MWGGTEGQRSDFPFLLPLVVNKALEQWLSTCGKLLWQISLFKNIYTVIHNSSKVTVIKQQQNNFMVGRDPPPHGELY